MHRDEASCHLVYSEDHGKTWAPLTHDEALVEPQCQGSVIRYTDTRDGYAKNRILFSNPPHSDSRWLMTVRMSFDDGKTWPISRVVDPGQSEYSCLTVLEDGTIGLLYERDQGHASQRIAFAHFNHEWLCQGRDELKADR